LIILIYIRILYRTTINQKQANEDIFNHSSGVIMEKQQSLEILNLADNFYQENNYKEALVNYKKALNFIPVDDTVTQADLFLKMGDLYLELEDYNLAQYYYKNSLRIYAEEEDHNGKGYSCTGLGIIQQKQKNLKSARKYYDRAQKSFKKTGDVKREEKVHSLEASTYESQGILDEVISKYKRTFQKMGQRIPGDFQESVKKQNKRSILGVSRGELVLSFVYLAALTIAEVLVTYINLQAGLVLEALILFALLLNSSLKTSYNFSTLLRSMMALPIIRIIGLSIPLMQIDALYWFPIISVPLFAASFTIMRAQGLSLKNVGFVLGNWKVQLLIAITGVFLGTIEYLILTPKPLIGTFNMENLIFASIILIISTGLAEEILFRGIIQKNAENVFGAVIGLLYTSLLFTALHIGWTSIYDLIFVFSVAVFYGYAFLKTRSLLGITLSHGLSNTMLFLVVPFYAPLIYSWLPF